MKSFNLKERLICLIVSMAVILPFGGIASASEIDLSVDYMQQMINVANDQPTDYISRGSYYESLRNRKIDILGVTEYSKTNIYTPGHSIHDIRKDLGLGAYKYTEAELDLLARLITAEAGCDWIPDWVQRAVGSVALNHLDSNEYPNTLWSVIYQPGVYSCVPNGEINRPAFKRCINNARHILEYGKTLPDGVNVQGPLLGRVYTSYYDRYLGTTIWFCYF